MITKRNFLPTICVIYSILVLAKLSMEAIRKITDPYYIENLLFMFAVVTVATLILGMHNFLQHVPLLFVIIGQYLVLICFVMVGVYVMSFSSPIVKGGYRDMFFSVTIPYIVFAGIYYISYFRNVRKLNKIIKSL